MSICTFALLFSACSKKEQVAVPDLKERTTKLNLSVPLSDGRTSIELKESPGLGLSGKNIHVSATNVFELPDKEYLKATCKISIENLTIGAVYDSVMDKRLTLRFRTGMKKYAPYPIGWSAKWNVKPFVEIESPSILYTMQQDHLTIMLSKPCTIFGFELTPNLLSTFDFTAGFYSSQQNSPLAQISQTVTTPSGARLFAAKSDVPFDVIEIQFNGNGSPYGFAIANLRYKLSK